MMCKAKLASAHDHRVLGLGLLLPAVILTGCGQRPTPALAPARAGIVSATPKPTGAPSRVPTAGAVAREARAVQDATETTAPRIVSPTRPPASVPGESIGTPHPVRLPSATPTVVVTATSDAAKEHVYQLPVTGEDWDCAPLQEPSARPGLGARITAEAALICLYGFAPGDRVALALYGPAGALQGSGLAIVWPDEEVARAGLALTLPGADRVGLWHLVARVDDVELVHDFVVRESGPVRGQVLCQGEPLAGAQVTVHRTIGHDGPSLASAVTDSDGRFAPDAPLGSLELRVSHSASGQAMLPLLRPFDLLTDAGADLGQMDVCAPTGVPPARRMP